MTEEEKRRIAAFIAAEKQRTAAAAVFNDHTAAITSSLETTARKNRIKSSLAQQGITWYQLRDAYNEEFDRGHTAMLDHHLAYFYAGIAIAFKEERPASSPDDVAVFVRAVYAMPVEITDRTSLIQQCRDETGVDVGGWDEDASYTPPRAILNINAATRKDREAVARMRKSGITQTDLEYERKLGYKNGWNSGFSFSVCYGAAALILHRSYGWTPTAIASYLERVNDLRYDEITSEDILERAKEEAGVDVSHLAKAPPTES